MGMNFGMQPDPSKRQIAHDLKIEMMPDDDRDDDIRLPHSVDFLTKDLTCFCQDHDSADFKIISGTVSFPAHKSVLSARSPFFKAFLSGPFQPQCYYAEDLDPHTLGRFLTFMYSGSTGEEALGWEEAFSLYYVAAKFEVRSLREECVAVLRRNVALENVCEILLLADWHLDEELRSVAQEFIIENYDEVLGSEYWEKLGANLCLFVDTLVIMGG